MAEMDIRAGVTFVRGIRDIEDNQREREAIQTEKNVYAAADVMDKMDKSRDDNEKINLAKQFSGYTPQERFKAIGFHSAQRKSELASVKDKFAIDYQNGLQLFQQSKVQFNEGQDLEGMQTLADIRNHSIKDGDKYTVSRTKDGRFAFERRNAKGELEGTEYFTKEQAQRMASESLSRPDNAFKAWSDGRQARKMKNAMAWDNAREYEAKDGSKLYRIDQVDPDSQEYIPLWFDNNGHARPVPTPEELVQYQDKGQSAADEKAQADLELTKAKTRKAGTEAKGITTAQKKFEAGEVDDLANKVVESIFNEAGFLLKKNGDVYKQSTDEDGIAVEQILPKKTAEKKRLFLRLQSIIKKHKGKDGNFDLAAIQKEIQTLKQRKKKDFPVRPAHKMKNEGIGGKNVNPTGGVGTVGGIGTDITY